LRFYLSKKTNNSTYIENIETKTESCARTKCKHF